MTPPQPAAPTAAPAAPAPAEKARTGDWIGGVLIALLFPLIGVIVGIIYAAQGGAKRSVGLATLAISVVAGLAYFAILSA